LVAADAPTDEGFRTALRSDDTASKKARATRRADGTLVGATRAQKVGSVLYVASATGGDLSESDLALVSSAAENATDVPVDVTYGLEVDDAAAPATSTLTDAIAARLGSHLATVPIGGTAPLDAIDTAIRAALGMRVTGLSTYGRTVPPLQQDGSSALVSLSVSAPAADVELGDGEVAVLGTVTPSVTRV
jgi:hypothetical protein